MSYIWNEILTAREAIIKLGKKPKYIFLWVRHSNMLLKGRELLITRDGHEYLKTLVKNCVTLLFKYL